MSDVSKTVISFFVFMLLARKLSPEGYGMFNTITALAAIFAAFAMSVSAKEVVLREITLFPKSTLNIFRNVFTIRTIATIVAIIILYIYQLTKGELDSLIVVITSVIVVATVFWDFAESIAFGHFVTKFTTIIGISTSIVWLIVVVIYPKQEINILYIIGIYALLFLLRAIIYLLLSYFKFAKNNLQKTEIGKKEILTMSMPYLWMRIVGVVNTQIPILLLSEYSGAEEVGFFSVGDRFVLPISLAVNTGLQAMFPFLTKLYKENTEKFKRKIVDTFIFVLIIGGAISILLTLSSEFWLPLMLGDAYMKAIDVFNLQAWFAVLLSFDLVLSTVLSTSYRQKVLAKIMTVDIFIVFPLLYFGTKYGADGMASAKLIGALITVFYHIFVVSYVLKINLITKKFAATVLYFVIFITTSIFVSSFIIKAIIIITTIIWFLLIKSSPLRSVILLVISKIKSIRHA